MMYLEFFGLQAKPFHTTPDPFFLYLSPSHKQALGSIIYGVKEKKGFIAVTGEVGLGKTTILRSFLIQIDQVNQQTIYLFNPNLSFANVLKKLLCELGHDPIEGSDAEVVDQLHMVLIDEYYKNKTVVLLIDDAQNMPVATLENLRMLSNLETSKDKLIQIVLLGQPELDSLLDRYELRQIRQRIALRATIHPLSEKESFQYIRHRLDKAGGEGKAIFTNGALKRIVREAKGIPRRLNILCDNALVTAFGYQKNPVTVHIAKEVMNDLAGKSSHALWKLIPLVTGVLILLLGLVALMPLTDSKFSHNPSLQKIKQLFGQGVERSHTLLTVSKDSNVSSKEDDLLSEASTSVPSEVESNFVDPAALSPIQLNSETGKHSSWQSVKSRSENLNEVAPSEFVPQVISVKNRATSMNSEAFSQHTVEKAKPVVEKPEGLSKLELGPQFRPVNNHVTSAQAEAVAQLTEAKVQNVVEKSERLSQLEIVSLVRLGKNKVATTIAEVVNHPTETKSKNIIEEPEVQPKVERMPQDTPVKDGTLLLNSSGKHQHESATSSTITKTMKKGDTLAGLMKEVYGLASPETLRLVLSHNRHIVNVRKIYPGQEILFPPLTQVEEGRNSTDDFRGLVSHAGKELRSAKKIFAESSKRMTANWKKDVATLTKPYAVAIVQEGDTLEKLAKMVYGSSNPLYVQRVLDFNPKILNPKNIFPGQDIVFPRVEEAKDLTHDSPQAHSRE